MTQTNVYLEAGQKKTFASALDWPGWSRSGRDEEKALQALLDYGSRYARVLENSEIDFQPSGELSQLIILERYAGDATTDFGSPAIIPDADRELFNQPAFHYSQIILKACWNVFDQALQAAEGKDLRKGPRGGGRDAEQIINHVIEADQAYLRRIAWKHKLEEGLATADQLKSTRQAILSALETAVKVPLPDHGPRGGIIWPARYFVRRTAWHVLDHTWEIEDRTE